MKAKKVYEFINPKTDEYDLEDTLPLGTLAIKVKEFVEEFEISSPYKIEGDLVIFERGISLEYILEREIDFPFDKVKTPAFVINRCTHVKNLPNYIEADQVIFAFLYDNYNLIEKVPDTIITNNLSFLYLNKLDKWFNKKLNLDYTIKNICQIEHSNFKSIPQGIDIGKYLILRENEIDTKVEEIKQLRNDNPNLNIEIYEESPEFYNFLRNNMNNNDIK